MTVRLFPTPAPTGGGDAVPLCAHELSRVRAAAHHARRALPGSLGELVHRELTAYADFGYRFSSDALIPRLVGEILATRVEEKESALPLGRAPAEFMSCIRAAG